MADRSSVPSLVLDHPRLALVLALIFAAIAVSGKFSMNATRLLLVIAWFIAEFTFLETYSVKSWRFACASVGFSTLLLLLAWWARPDTIPSYGELTARRQQLFPMYCGDDYKLTGAVVEWGDSGTRFHYNGYSSGEPIMSIMSMDLLAIDVLNGELAVTIQIRAKDNPDMVLLDMRDNDYIPNPQIYDVQKRSNELEVIDSHDRVLLQVMLLPNRVQLQGEWWGRAKDGTIHGIRIGRWPYPCPSTYNLFGAKPDWRCSGPDCPHYSETHGCMFMQGLSPQYDPGEPKIEPRFRYRSQFHPGELRTDYPTMPKPLPDLSILVQPGLIIWPAGDYALFSPNLIAKIHAKGSASVGDPCSAYNQNVYEMHWLAVGTVVLLLIVGWIGYLVQFSSARERGASSRDNADAS
jgi:hypothetical protein